MRREEFDETFDSYDRYQAAVFQYEGLARFVDYIKRSGNTPVFMIGFYEHMMLNLATNLYPLTEEYITKCMYADKRVIEFINKQREHSEAINNMAQAEVVKPKDTPGKCKKRDNLAHREELYKGTVEIMLRVLSGARAAGRSIMFDELELEISTTVFHEPHKVANMDIDELEAMSRAALLYEKQGV